MARPSWTFERTRAMGGATGEAFVNTLFGIGMPPAAVLAREAIQNSSDAKNPGGEVEKVRVVFRRMTLTGKDKSEFVKRLQLTEHFRPRRKQLDLQPGNCLDSLSADDVPLRLLYIEDYETHGLYGDPHDDSSPLFRLLFSLGDSSKARERESEGSGGSYGYGKAVYSANSRIHSIFVFSVFDPKRHRRNGHARLMGCSYFNRHRFERESYSGRAFFGDVKKEGELVDPLEEADAHNMAKLLGFQPRAKTDTGTSILLVDATVDCDELRTSIEDWWWPRLVDESVGLDVELYEQGRRVEPPRPRSREHLSPFIACFDLALGRASPQGASERSGIFNRLNNVALGGFGLKVLPEELAANERLQETKNSFALIRAPRMVVDYMNCGHLPMPCVGTFVADPAIDTFLKHSEPAAHDKWDPKSARLDNLAPFARVVVSKLSSRLKGALRKFAAEASPPVSKTEARVKLLERLVGTLFRPPTKAPGGGGASEADPIRIHFTVAPHIVPDGDYIRTAGAVRVSLAEDFPDESADVELELGCLVVEDEGVSEDDAVAIEAASDDVDFERVSEKPLRLKFVLEKDAPAIFRFGSGTYDQNWTTEVKAVVRREAAE